MKTFLTLLILIVGIFFSKTLHAKEIDFYLGIGGSYSNQNFDTIDAQMLDFGNSFGVNAKMGIASSSRLFSIEFDFDYLPDFEADESFTEQGIPIEVSGEVNIMTFIFGGKFSPDLNSKIFKPFVFVGLGIMHGKVDASASASYRGNTVSMSESISETGACYKLGVGMDFFISNSVSIGLDGGYVWGASDMDGFDYFNSTLGLAYHF